MKTAVRTYKDRYGTVWSNTFGNMWETQKTRKTFDQPLPLETTEDGRKSYQRYITVTGTTSTLKHIDDISW